MTVEERKEKTAVTLFLGFLLGLAYFSNNSLIIAITSIQKDLEISTTNLNWVVNAYNISIASVLVIAGRICDRFGSLKALRLVLPIYIFGSLLCIFTSDTFVLVLGRFFQGWSLAFVFPSMARIVNGNFHGKELGKAIGFYNGIASIFMPLGFFLGGLICTYSSWRYIYVIDGCWGVVLWVLTFFFFKKDSPIKMSKIHLPSFLLFTAGLFSFIAVLMEGKIWGWGSSLSLILYGVSLLSFFIFYLVNRKAKDPLLHFSLFRSPSTIAAFFVMFCASSVYLISVMWSIYLQFHFQLSAFVAGSLLLLTVVPEVLCSAFIGSLIDRNGTGKLISYGLILGALGAGVVLYGIYISSIWVVALGFLVYGNYLIFCWTPTSVLLYSSIEPSRRGKIFAAYKLWSQISVLIGFSFMAAIMVSGSLNQIDEGLERYQLEGISALEVREISTSQTSLAELKTEYSTETINILKQIVLKASKVGLENTMWIPILIFLAGFVLFNLYRRITKSTF